MGNSQTRSLFSLLVAALLLMGLSGGAASAAPVTPSSLAVDDREFADHDAVQEERGERVTPSADEGDAHVRETGEGPRMRQEDAGDRGAPESLGLSASSAADDCVPTSLGGWGRALPETLVPGGGTACRRITTGSAGRYVIRVRIPRGSISVALTEVGGDRIYSHWTSWSSEDLSTLSLKASTQYDFTFASTSDEEISLQADLLPVASSEGCGPLETTWSSAPRSLDFVDGSEVLCGTFTGAPSNRLRIDDSSHSVRHAIIDAGGNVLCEVQGDASHCGLTGGGPWKVVSYASGDFSANPSGTQLWVSNFASTVGCSTVELASWSGALPVRGERSARPADCFVVRTGAAGTYGLRGYNQSQQWGAAFELFDAQGQRVSRFDDRYQGRGLSLVDLKGSHDYRVVVSGDPEGYSGEFAGGVYRVADSTGCGVLATGWDSSGVAIELASGDETVCHTVVGSAGQRLRFARDDEGDFTHQVLNSSGDEVCSVSGNPGSCILSGTGPWKVLTAADTHNGASSVSTRLWVNNFASTQGCSKGIDETVSLVSERVSFVRSASTGIDCHQSGLARNSAVRLDVVQSTTDRIVWWMLDANGVSECSGYGTTRAENCVLEGPAPYRLLVDGEAGAAYEVGARRVSSPVGCSQVDGITSGVEPREGSLTRASDQRCFRFDGGAGDELTLAADNADLEGRHFALELYDPEGRSMGTKSIYDATRAYSLEQAGGYLAVVSLDSAVPGRFTFSGTCANPACGPDGLNVASVSPTQVGAASEVTLSVRGKSLTRDTQFRLVQNSVTVVGDLGGVTAGGRASDVVFDLSGRSGSWQLEAQNPDGQVSKLSGAVRVGQRVAPRITTELVALDRFVAGRPQTISVIATNHGNVDGLGAPLYLTGLPVGTTIEPKFDLRGIPEAGGEAPVVPFTQNQVYEANGQVGLPLLISRIPGGQSVQLDFEINVPVAADYELNVSGGQCFFDDQGGQSGQYLSRGADPDGWGEQGCLDATIDVAASFIPGGHCVSAFTSSFLEGTRRFASDAPPSAVNAFFGIGDWVACAASFVPGGNVAAGMWSAFSTVATGSQFATECLLGSSRQSVTNVASIDPNEIVGPSGGGGQHAFRGEGTHRYAVYFENDKSATAPAQEVKITNQLDPQLYDLSTLRFAGIQFGTRVFTPPKDSRGLDQVYDLERADGLQLDIDAAVSTAGLVSWHLASVDPFTGKLPQDPFIGFLPPNEDGTEGQGVAYYEVAYKQPTNGQVIPNVADIVFDLNEPIRTNTWVNLIDRDLPTSGVSVAAPTTSDPSFDVTWTAADTTSGVAGVDVLVSRDGSAYEIWRGDVQAGTATFEGQPGHQYAFTAIARDWAGNRSAVPPTPHATVTVTNTPLTGTPVTVSGSGRVGQVLTVAGGDFGPLAQRSITWRRDGATILGATSATYTVTGSDAGRRLTAVVEGRATGHTPVVVSSTPVAVPAANRVKPSIRGTVKAAKQVTAYAGRWFGSGFAYRVQWKVNGRAVRGATKNAFMIPRSARGKNLSLAVTASKEGFAAVTARSSTVRVK